MTESKTDYERVKESFVGMEIMGFNKFREVRTQTLSEGDVVYCIYNNEGSLEPYRSFTIMVSGVCVPQFNISQEGLNYIVLPDVELRVGESPLRLTTFGSLDRKVFFYREPLSEQREPVSRMLVDWFTGSLEANCALASPLRAGCVAPKRLFVPESLDWI